MSLDQALKGLGGGGLRSALLSGVSLALPAVSAPKPLAPELTSAFEANKAYVKPGASGFNTALPPQAEAVFRAWLAQNNVPFDPNAAVSDYDMRGFWQALQAGDPKAQSAIDPNDAKLHYPDYWKTPYHQTFSNESQWAVENAPRWTDDDKLVAPDGTVLYDDRAKKKKAQ